MSWKTLEGTKNGHDLFSTTVWMGKAATDPYIEQRAAAIEKMGERYVGHPSRRVPRGQYEQKESHGADVAATFARVREKLAPPMIIQEGQ
jgi:hypothetical protein